MPRNRRSLDRKRPRRRAGISFAGALILFIAVVALVTRLESHGETAGAARAASRVRCGQVRQAFHRKLSGKWLTMAGVISRILPDEHGTSTHQRFILRCRAAALTVLIVNNVDVGERAAIVPGERVAAHGQYIWDHLGGLIHDTHHSTDSNPNGWIFAGGRVYQ